MKLSTIGLVMTAKFEIKAHRSRWKRSASKIDTTYFEKILWSRICFLISRI